MLPWYFFNYFKPFYYYVTLLKAEDRRPKTEDRRQKTEDRRPKTEGPGRAEDSAIVALLSSIISHTFCITWLVRIFHNFFYVHILNSIYLKYFSASVLFYYCLLLPYFYHLRDFIIHLASEQGRRWEVTSWYDTYFIFIIRTASF